MKGRPRYRLKDTWASYVMTVHYLFTESQYQEFLNFWFNEIKGGLEPFTIHLMLDDENYYRANDEIYMTRATASFDSNSAPHNLWEVSFPIEIAAGFRTNLFDCPSIYGGPISAPAADDIYGGPITALAPDVIVPCPGVDPNG